MDSNTSIVIRNLLIRRASLRSPVSYDYIAEQVNESTGLIKTMLAAISVDSMEKYGCLLSAIVIEPDGTPMNGFFKFAKQIGAMNDDDDLLSFWMNETTKVFERFSSMATPGIEEIGKITVGERQVGIRSIAIDVTGGPDLIIVEVDIPNPFKRDKHSPYMSLRAIAPRGEGHRFVEKYFGAGSVTKIIEQPQEEDSEA